MPVYVFLGAGGTAFLSGVRWPAPANGRPGEWVEGVQGYEVADLPWALDDELWEVELAGAVTRVRTALHAERGRLVRRVGTWTAAVADELAAVCEERVREHAREAAADERSSRRAELLEGFADDVASYAAAAGGGARGAAVAAYIAAHAVAGGDKAAPGYERRFALERGWQAEWLRARLSL